MTAKRTRRLVRRGAWLVTGLLAAAAFATTWASMRAGLALLALAVLAGFAATFLSLQELLAFARRTEKAVSAGRPAARPTDQLSAHFAAVHRALDAQPYLNAELVRRYQQLIPDDRPMPTLGANWAATAPTILYIIDRILADRSVETVLECGSGASTVWAAAAFRQRGSGHVISLDHDARFAEVTRQNLAAHELSGYATIATTPLVDVEVPGRGTMPWYDLSKLPSIGIASLEELGPIDLLFVDGPPRPTGPMARFPAFPVLAPALRSGALIVLDDANRSDERRIAQEWAALPGVRKLQNVGRSVVLQWTAPA